MSKYDWRKLRSVLIQRHNIHVKRSISKIRAAARQNNNATRSKQIDVLRYCLIDANDSINIALEKQNFYWFDLGYFGDRIQAVASVPDSWQLKKFSHTPQLVIIYRKTKKSRSGNYELTIPHYDGTIKPTAPTYKKGNRSGILILKDNSKLVVNAHTDAEAERVVRHFRKYINPRYLTEDFRITARRGKPVEPDEYKPIRADYYPQGDEDTHPKWRHYY